jgi:hypothetical protein
MSSSSSFSLDSSSGSSSIIETKSNPVPLLPIQSLDFNENTKTTLSGELNQDPEYQNRIIRLIIPMLNDEKYEVTVRQAAMAEQFKNALFSDPNATEIPFIGKTIHLKYIVEYMKHHENKEITYPCKPVKSTELKESVTDPWDAEFADRIWSDYEKIDPLAKDFYLLSNAVDGIGLIGMLHLLMAKLASKIRGKSLDQLKELFGLPADHPLNKVEPEDIDAIIDEEEKREQEEEKARAEKEKAEKGKNEPKEENEEKTK